MLCNVLLAVMFEVASSHASLVLDTDAMLTALIVMYCLRLMSKPMIVILALCKQVAICIIAVLLIWIQTYICIRQLLL